MIRIEYKGNRREEEEGGLREKRVPGADEVEPPRTLPDAALLLSSLASRSWS